MVRILPMMHPRDYLPFLDKLEAALEAACDALMMLQSIHVATAPEADGMSAHLTEAMISLRHSIVELRAAENRGASGLALGFVLAKSRQNSIKTPGPGQSSPRRTA